MGLCGQVAWMTWHQNQQPVQVVRLPFAVAERHRNASLAWEHSLFQISVTVLVTGQMVNVSEDWVICRPLQ